MKEFRQLRAGGTPRTSQENRRPGLAREPSLFRGATIVAPISRRCCRAAWPAPATCFYPLFRVRLIVFPPLWTVIEAGGPASDFAKLTRKFNTVVKNSSSEAGVRGIGACCSNFRTKPFLALRDLEGDPILVGVETRIISTWRHGFGHRSSLRSWKTKLTADGTDDLIQE